MKIVICDDNKEFVYELLKYIKRYESIYQTEFQTYPFYDTKAMLDFLNANSNIEILFLDVMFADSNGIEVAKQIRERNWKVKIFFVSSYEQYAVKGYGVYADGYLLKPLEYEIFEMELSGVLQRIQGEKIEIFLENTNQGKVIIDWKDIIFIETYHRNTRIHTVYGKYVSCRRMKDYEEALKDDRFYRCHAAYIVNMEYIRRIDTLQIVLKDGTELSVSKKRRKEFMNAFARYVNRLINL